MIVGVCRVPKIVRRIILKVLFLLGLRRVMRHVQRQRVAILMYHGFTDRRGRQQQENLEGNHLHIDKFARQVEYLVRHHHVASLEEVIDALCTGATLPDHTVVLTMDDGYRSNYKLAFPILKRHAAKATIFITTEFVNSKEPLWPDRVERFVQRAKPAAYEVILDGTPLKMTLRTEGERLRAFATLVDRLKTIPQEKRDAAVDALANGLLPRQAAFDGLPDIYRPLEWHEIKEMLSSGVVSVGNHTHTHVILSRVDGTRRHSEIQTAHDIIQKKTGVRCNLFCYPNGLEGDFDAETQRLLKQLGYRCALTAIAGFNDRASNLFELRRFPMLHDASFDEFLLSLYGGLRGLMSRAMHRSSREAKVSD